MTADAAVEHEDERMPTLNVKIWIGKTNEGTTKILHTHYMKGVSSRAVINAASAHSMEMKKNVMVNEVCTILKNCSRYQEWEEVTRHVEYFMKRLQYSGYDQRFKYEVLRRALNRHDKRVEEYRRTGTMYRIRSEEERRKRRKEKQEWYRKSGKYDSVMFVEATPDGALRERIQKLSDTHRMRIKVVDK